MSDTREEDIIQAGLRSRNVMAWLRDHKLPATSICYTLVYEFLFSENIELKQTVSVQNFESKEGQQALEQLYSDCINDKHFADLSKHEENINTYVSEILYLLILYREKMDLDYSNMYGKSVELEPSQDQYLEIMEDASLDDLTQILDQSGMMSTCKSLIEHEENYPISMIYVDIDHFRQFNKANGENMGNAVLKQIAKAFTSQLRGNDIVSRYKRDTFLLVLPKTKVANAVALAEVLRKKVESISLKKKGALTPVKVTTSSGVSIFENKEGFNAAIDIAEKSMLRSKDFGRNCVNQGL